MERNIDFNFGWNEANNLDPPWGRSGASAGTGRRTAKQASAVPASLSEHVGYNGFVAVITDDLQVDAFLKCVMLQFNSFREEIRQMAQAPAPSQQAASRGNAGKPSTSTGQRSGFPFLKVEMMSRDPKPAKIMDFQIPPEPTNGQRKFNDVILQLYYGGGIVLWGLKTSSPHYVSLYSWFGGDLDDWKDKSFLLGTEVREFDGRVFAHVEQIPEKSEEEEEESNKPKKRK